MAAKTPKRDGLWDYRPSEGMTGVDRSVDFLLWAAKNFPYRPVPITHIARVALSEPKLPKEESTEVISFRKSKMKTIRKKLMRDNKRGLVYHPGMGYRATVDSEDVVENVMEKNRKRVQSSIASMSETESIVDRKDLKSARVKNRFEDLSEASKRLNAPAIQNRLTPPEEPGEDKDDEE